jgi:hypothetical protein
MAVVVNEFEVVNAPPAQAGAPGGPTEQQHQQAPDPIKAEEDLERALRNLRIRTSRIHAT